MCESCTKPLTEKNRGTDSTGGISDLYCESCFQHGEFVEKLTLDEMQEHVTQVLKGKGIPAFIRERIVANVENLERWRIL